MPRCLLISVLLDIDTYLTYSTCTACPGKIRDLKFLAVVKYQCSFVKFGRLVPVYILDTVWVEFPTKINTHLRKMYYHYYYLFLFFYPW